MVKIPEEVPNTSLELIAADDYYFAQNHVGKFHTRPLVDYEMDEEDYGFDYCHEDM